MECNSRLTRQEDKVEMSNVGQEQFSNKTQEKILVHSGLVEYEGIIYGSLYKTLDGRTFVGITEKTTGPRIVEMKNGIIDYPHLIALGAVGVRGLCPKVHM